MRRRNVMALGLAVLLVATSALTSGAADIGALADRAKAAAARNDYEGALDALQTAVETLRAEAPLALRPVHVVTRPAKAYGDYEPRKDTVFRRGEPIQLYLEPKNLVYPRTAQGTYEPAFAVDLQVLDAGGTVLFEKEGANSFRFASRSRVQDIYVNLKVDLSGAQRGEYKVRLVVRDSNSKKAATVVQPITLR